MLKKGYDALNEPSKNLLKILAVVLPLVFAIMHAIILGEGETTSIVMTAVLAGMVSLGSYIATVFVVLAIMSRKDRPIEKP